MQDFSSLGLELLKYGFRKVLFLEVSCLHCGDHRIGCDASCGAENTVPACPSCGRMVPASGILCVGFSKREMPFSERIKAPLGVNARSWINTSIDDDDKLAVKIRREQKHGQTVRLFNTRKMRHAGLAQ